MRRVFIVHLQPLDGRDGIRELRWALKFLLRRFGLKAISVEEVNHADTDEIDGADRRLVCTDNGRRADRISDAKRHYGSGLGETMPEQPRPDGAVFERRAGNL
jgi:hypothetical protein